MSEIPRKLAVTLTPAVFHILLALVDGPLHGYAIMKSVRATAGPDLPAGAGTIYGSLRRMVGDGLLEQARSRSGRSARRPRKLYVVTARGRQALEREAARMINAVELLRARGVAPRSS